MINKISLTYLSIKIDITIINKYKNIKKMKIKTIDLKSINIWPITVMTLRSILAKGRENKNLAFENSPRDKAWNQLHLQCKHFQLPH